MTVVSSRLRAAREQAGVPIEEIAARTRIKVAFLHAMERGEFERLPGEFFARAFLRTYARELHLSAADRLLDLGSGRGWPGLYLAARTGCRVILTDLPLEGLRVAANRAASEALAARTGVVASAASGLPFQAGSFDVIIHTDVLC